MSHHVLRRALRSALLGAAALTTLAALATGAAGAGGATAAAAPEGEEPAPSGTVTWALEPATADGPDGRVSLRHEVDAGGMVIDAVALTNYSDSPASFEVYVGAGTVTSGGDFDVVTAEPGAAGDAAWVTVGPLDGAASIAGGVRLELPASSTVVVPLTVRVPSNATPGAQPGALPVTVGDGVRGRKATGERGQARPVGGGLCVFQGATIRTLLAAWSPPRSMPSRTPRPFGAPS